MDLKYFVIVPKLLSSKSCFSEAAVSNLSSPQQAFWFPQNPAIDLTVRFWCVEREKQVKVQDVGLQ